MEESMLKYKIALSMIRGVGLLTYKKLISVFGDDEYRSKYCVIRTHVKRKIF